MRWFKRERGKASLALAGLLLLLILMVWVPVSAAGASERASGLATPVPGTVQATPVVNQTIAAETANEQLRKFQRDNDRSANAWFWNSNSFFGTVIAALLAVVGVFVTVGFNFRQWTGTPKTEREKERTGQREAQDKDLKDKAEERFKTTVTALGGEKEGVQLGGAILLRSFLNKGDEKIYGRYYTQIFDLAVAYLRLPRTSNPPEDSDGIPHSPEDPNAPLPLTTLRQALIAVFTEAFQLVRDERIDELRKEQREDLFDPKSFNATYIRLDHAFLWETDLRQVWMAWASLRETDLTEANLTGALLWHAKLEKAKLCGANLSKADLGEAKLCGANLGRDKDPHGREIPGAKLCGAILKRARLDGANLEGANLSGAYLEGANPEDAGSLNDTQMNGVIGLTPEQRELCIKKEAIFDDVQQAPAPDTNSSSSLPSAQSNDTQVPSTPSTQVNTPPPSAGGNGAACSELGPES